MKAFFVFLLWCIVLVALALFSWGLTLYLAWPYWGGLAIFFGVIAVYFGIKLLRRLWVVSRSRVKLAASEAAGRTAVESPNGIAELTRKWKEAIATLRSSSLRRFGNPVYALPWFMVVGDSGVGKTSAITRSRLSSLNKSVSQFEPITQTVNCDWWFFNRAVIIDTAGRYVSADGNPDDQAEWERMLELLAKYRMKEGLNGMVLTIDTDQLLNADADALARRGHVFRERIDQLIRLFDKRFPIFVLVTKCDRVYGFNEWAHVLPADALNQAMGYVGPTQQGDGAEQQFLDTAYQQINQRLKALRLDMAVKGVELSPGLLLFPSELERLRDGLQHFLTACLGNNPYLEQPLLRGLFFSSARQTGEHIPSALAHLLTDATRTVTSEKGVFLHDFFEQILPADRWTFMPTVIVNRWRQATRNLAAVFWISIFTAALVFVLVSYYQTRSSLREIETSYPKQAQIANQTGDEQVRSLHKILSMIDLIRDREDNWQTRWLAFSPDITKLEEDIKAAYVRGYQEYLRKNDYEALFPKVMAMDRDSPLYANTVLAIVRNINLSQARLNGADYDQLLAMPQIPTQVTRSLRPDLPPEIINASDRMLVAFKAWSPANDAFLRQNLSDDRETLRQLLNQSSHLEWLLPWADARNDLQPVTLREFWLPGSQGKNEGMIEPALTLRGEDKIKAFLKELGQAFDNSPEFEVRRGAFLAWYQSERFNTWQSFAWSFHNGEQLLANEPAWREMVTRIDTDASPYYRFFDRLKTEFADIPAEQLPNWLLFSREFSTMRRAAISNSTLGKAEALVETINAVGQRVIPQSVQQRSFSPANGGFSRSINGVQAFAAYAKDFDAAAAEALGGDGKAYQLASDYFAFSVDPNVKASLLQTTQNSLDAFRKASGYDSADDQVIWHLVGGPLRLLTNYTLEQASCNVQKDWEKNVLWKTQMAVSARETIDQLFGEKGSVWTFADGPAKPFIQQKATQFTVARKGDYSFPFSADFIPFLNRSVNTRVESVVKSQLAEASMGKAANLLITALPVGVNPGAKAKPYSVSLSIQCAHEEITLDNFNMEVTNSFDWSPDQCGDVTLQIRLDNLTLTRRYPGPMGMARFVQEFVDGERIFTPDDFPQARDQLDALDVRTIHVRYNFVGQEALLTMADHLDYLAETSTPSLSATPKKLDIRVPERVGLCWTDGIPDQPASPLPLYIRQRAEEIIKAPPPPPEPERISAPPPPPKPLRTHRVQEGETLYSLARKFGTTVDELQRLNHLKNTDLIITGHILKLPPE
ncbi:MAG: type VI secretion protein IcmF/TssM N-terminal domain-containing protein [Burkholderiaceae bacterium]